VNLDGYQAGFGITGMAKTGYQGIYGFIVSHKELYVVEETKSNGQRRLNQDLLKWQPHKHLVPLLGETSQDF
jgi:hypothetical protein